MGYIQTTFSSLKTIVPFIMFFALSTGCDTVPGRERADAMFLITDKTDIYYDLKKHTDKFFLPYVLSEISGLTMDEKGRLLTIEDETGKVFIYDMKMRDIDYGITFAKSGDYEGVEIIGNQVYVLKSDGDLYNFKLTTKKKVKAEKIETPLGKSNDTEGLGYYPAKNQLLIACKEDGGIKGEKVKGKTVYAYDLDTDDFKKQPKLTITKKDLKKFYEENKDFQYDENRIKFEPSAIAWHPIHEKFYVLASVGKLLVVLNTNGDIEATYPISPNQLSQPEGICFAPNGDMYISSEGEGDRGYILKFPMLRK
jgi:uncharacterized protein YjiK